MMRCTATLSIKGLGVRRAYLSGDTHEQSQALYANGREADRVKESSD